MIHTVTWYTSTEICLRKIDAGELIPKSKTEVILTMRMKIIQHWHNAKPMTFETREYVYPFGAPDDGDRI